MRSSRHEPIILQDASAGEKHTSFRTHRSRVINSNCSTPGVRTLEKEDEQDDQENKRQQEKIRHWPLLPVIDTKNAALGAPPFNVVPICRKYSEADGAKSNAKKGGRGDS